MNVRLPAASTVSLRGYSPVVTVPTIVLLVTYDAHDPADPTVDRRQFPLTLIRLSPTSFVVRPRKQTILNTIVEVFVTLEVEWTQQTRSD